MKTKEIIEELRHLARVFDKLGDYKKGGIICEAANRLEELSTGNLTITAKIYTKIYTIHEIARMHDIRGRYIEDLVSENTRLRLRIDELEGKVGTSYE